VGSRNWTFAGSDEGGRRAAAIYTLIASARLNDNDPQAWLADVLARLPDHPAKRIHERGLGSGSLSAPLRPLELSQLPPKVPWPGPSPDAYLLSRSRRGGLRSSPEAGRRRKWSDEEGAHRRGDRGERQLGVFRSSTAWIVAAAAVWLAAPVTRSRRRSFGSGQGVSPSEAYAACGASPSRPAVTREPHGTSHPRTAIWILVLRPPRERPCD
jgi:hypothetical protein